MLGKEPNKIFSNPKDRLPKILDEVHFLESANDSARHFRNVYAVYLTLMLYTFVVILSVDHELLFRAGDKQLPLINISVPIVEFFTYMPLALLVVHFYLLIQAAFLSEKVSLYRSRLKYRLQTADINAAKGLLSSLPLAHILVDKGFQGKRPFMLYAIVFISLVIFPLGVLITAQIKFLPYQDVLITWAYHRVVVIIDIGLLWYFYFRIFVAKGDWWGWFESKGKFIFKFLTILIAVYIIMFADFPSKGFVEFTSSGIVSNHFDLPNYKLVKRGPAPEILATYINKEAYDEKSIKPGSSIWCEYAEPLDDLEERNFRKAQLRDTIFCNVDLYKADLTAANFGRATLTGANLEKVTLISADLEKATLTAANLKYANLTDAELHDVDLIGAILTFADLKDANLIDADLRYADLKDANLIDADLTDADLTDADLKSANFTSVRFVDANLTNADLRYATLTAANLTKANLTSAHLVYTNLTAANLSKTDFSDATISKETVLDYTWIWEGYLPRGNPKDWHTTLKPKYICLFGFFISHHINVFEYSSEEEEQEKLKNALGQVIEKNCKPYNDAPE